MKRTSRQSHNQDLPQRLFASNPALLIGAAFEIGMLLGRRSGRTAVGRKVRDGVNRAAGEAVRLAPDSMVKLVPQLAPAKAPRRRRAARK